MGGKCGLKVLLSYFLLSVLHISTVQLKRVVFQTISLGYRETVQCYGRCLQDSDQFQKFNLTRCAGPKIRFDCNPGYRVNIKATTVGKLSPDLDICRPAGKLECVKDVTAEIQAICNQTHRCVIDIRKDTLRSKCGKVKYPSMDIHYSCAISPQATTSTKATTAPSNAVKQIPTIRDTSITSLITNTTLHATNNKRDRTTDGKTKITWQTSKDNNMFWIVTAFVTITDSQFIRKHKTSLALALILSIVFGMIIIIIYCCVFLHYCRRGKSRDEMQSTERRTPFVTYPQEVKCNQSRQMVKPNTVDVINLNEYYPKTSVSNDDVGFYNHSGCHNNNNGGYHNKNNDKRKNEVYSSMSIARPVLKQIPEHKLVNYDIIVQSDEMPLSPSSTSELLTPPSCNYNGDIEGVPYLVLTCPTPTGSATNTLLKSKRIIAHDKSESETETVYLQEEPVDENLKDSEYEYVEIGQYLGSDGYSSSPQFSHSTRYHTTDNYIVPTKVKFAQMNRHVTSNDEETSQEDTLLRHLDTKRLRARKYAQKDKPGVVHKSKSLDGIKKRGYLSSSGNECLTRNPRRGRAHVMQRCEETPPQRITNQRATYSDNEATRRRRRCDAEYNHAHDIGTPRYMLYCSTCGISKESHLNCCSSQTSNCQSSHDEDFPDYGSLPSRFNRRMKNQQFSVEESGYQSHDTGTDSLCSSTFSTDQEESRMFAPAAVSSTLHHGCRPKVYHTRTQTCRRSPKYILVRKHNARVPRRLRRDDYTNVDARTHLVHTYTSAAVHPYNSSLDDGSSRESVKIIRRNDKANMSDGCVTDLHEDTNCNCNFES